MIGPNIDFTEFQRRFQIRSIEVDQTSMFHTARLQKCSTYGAQPIVTLTLSTDGLLALVAASKGEDLSKLSEAARIAYEQFLILKQLST